jgi:hypothetical protein
MSSCRFVPTIVLATSLAVTFAACGDDSEPAAASYPTDPDIAVVRVGYPTDFPDVVIAGDGWAYTLTDAAADGSADDVEVGNNGDAEGFVHPAARSALSIAPAPPEPLPIERRRLTARGIEIVLARADELGLLAVPNEYADPQVTDVGGTFVSFAVDDGTFEHEAYALGYVDETGNRKDLSDFVDEVSDLETLVGADNVGPAEPYAPSLYQVRTQGSFDTEGYDVTWPSDVPVEDGCIELPVDRFPDGAAGTFIAEVNSERIRVFAVPDLPGDDCV